MTRKNVFVLVHSNVDYVNVEVYEKEEDAFKALEELAAEYDMEVYGDEASGDENYAILKEKEIY